MACSYFPDDVMTEILKRLPLKSLLQFHCVSKSWQALIRSPNFASEHRIFSNGRPSPDSESILVLDRDQNFWHLSGDNLESKERLDYFKERLDGFPLDYGLSLYGCCHGIVCAAVSALHRSKTLFLWNPATREYKNLPPFCIPDFARIGFGFDPKYNDYKVVRIVSYRGQLTRKRVEVYSMRSNSWREIKSLEPEGFLVDGLLSVPDRCVNGVLFWMCSDGDSNISSILVFDMGEEEFKVVDMPPSLKFPSCFKFNQSSIAVLDVLLSAGHIDVWVMEDVEFKNLGGTSSWVKQFTISAPCSSPLGFTSRGELLCKTPDGQLGFYCLTDHRVKVKTLIEDANPTIAHFVCYRESLAPLSGENMLRIRY